MSKRLTPDFSPLKTVILQEGGRRIETIAPEEEARLAAEFELDLHLRMGGKELSEKQRGIGERVRKLFAGLGSIAKKEAALEPSEAEDKRDLIMRCILGGFSVAAAGVLMPYVPAIYDLSDDLSSEKEVAVKSIKAKGIEDKISLIGESHLKEEITYTSPELRIHTVKVDFDRDGTWDSVHSTCYGDNCVVLNETEDLNVFERAARKWIGHNWNQ